MSSQITLQSLAQKSLKQMAEIRNRKEIDNSEVHCVTCRKMFNKNIMIVPYWWKSYLRACPDCYARLEKKHEEHLKGKR